MASCNHSPNARPSDNVVMHTEILKAYEEGALDDEVGNTTGEGIVVGNSKYLCNWKLCGFSIFSVKFKRELTDKYITKLFGVDVIFPILILCGCFVYFPTFAMVVLSTVFWSLVFLLSFDVTASRERTRPTLRSFDSDRCSPPETPERVTEARHTHGKLMGDGNHSNNGTNSTYRNSQKSKYKSDGYDSDDGEIVSVMGGF
jgi:hypothetical protein